MKCANCNEDFRAKRTTAKFCSDKCRVYANRVDVTGPYTEKQFRVAERAGLVKQDKACKHGFPPAFCRFAKSGKPCK